MAAGMAVAVVGLVCLTKVASDSSYVATFLPAWSLFGFGLGLAQVGIVGAATEHATPEERGVVGGLVNTGAQLGTAVGLALLVMIAGWPSDEI